MTNSRTSVCTAQFSAVFEQSSLTITTEKSMKANGLAYIFALNVRFWTSCIHAWEIAFYLHTMIQKQCQFFTELHFFPTKYSKRKKKHGSIRKNNNKNGSIKLFFTSRSQRAMDVCLKQTERTVVHKQAQLIVAGHRDSPWGINIIFMYTQWKQILLHMQFHATTHSYSKSPHTALRLSVFCSSSLLPCSLDSVRACSTVNKLL